MASPRIYTYKISFPDQGWWYWGVHKERVHGEFYMGSPITHKAKWDFFYHEKQILEFFDTWEEACEVEKRLIRPDIDNPNCLNEAYGGSLSLKSCSKGGKVQAEIRLLSGATAEMGRKQGRINSESGHLDKIRTLESTRKGGLVGGSKGGKIGGPIAAKIQHSQRWKCLVTGYVTTPAPLSRYQKARGIDTSLRERVK